MVDYQGVDREFDGAESKAELVLNGGEDGDGVAAAFFLGEVGTPSEGEVACAFEARVIDDDPMQAAVGENTRKCGHG